MSRLRGSGDRRERGGEEVNDGILRHGSVMKQSSDTVPACWCMCSAAHFLARAFLHHGQERTQKKSRVWQGKNQYMRARAEKQCSRRFFWRENLAVAEHVGSRRLAARTSLQFEMRGR